MKTTLPDGKFVLQFTVEDGKIVKKELIEGVIPEEWRDAPPDTHAEGVFLNLMRMEARTLKEIMKVFQQLDVLVDRFPKILGDLKDNGEAIKKEIKGQIFLRRLFDEIPRRTPRRRG